MTDWNGNSDLPTPIHHPPMPPIPKHWRRYKYTGPEAPCPECGVMVNCDPGDGFARCWECKQPKPRKAP